jgi:glycosyltransferase involved in cell wall biosynthesis
VRGGATGKADVSVILPFANAAPHIRDQLEALAEETFSGKWEVIAVDNASQDGSRAIVEEFRDRLDLVIVDAHDKQGSAYARNVGARAASGGKLLFVDADDQIAPGYVSAMAAALDRDDFVTAAHDPVTLNPEWVRGAHGPVRRDPNDPDARQWGVMPFADAGSTGIRRSVFEGVGGFPEELPRMVDIAFSWDVQLAGTPLRYAPEALYRVRYRDTLLGLFRQTVAWGEAGPLMYRRYHGVGLRRRTVPQTLKLWLKWAIRLLRARSKADLAKLVVMLGGLVGRVKGSIRHRVLWP